MADKNNILHTTAAPVAVIIIYTTNCISNTTTVVVLIFIGWFGIKNRYGCGGIEEIFVYFFVNHDSSLASIALVFISNSFGVRRRNYF